MASPDPVYPNLIAEMARIGISRKDLAAFLNKDPATISNWMLGQNGDFPITQALAVQHRFFPSVELNELFERREVA